MYFNSFELPLWRLFIENIENSLCATVVRPTAGEATKVFLMMRWRIDGLAATRTRKSLIRQ